VFGNEYLEEDKLSRDISEYLDGKFEIIHCRSPDELLEADEDEILILDVVKNIKEPMIIDDLAQIKVNKMMSLHDFDVGFFLNLMKEMGINKKIKIIGVPQQGNIREIKEKVETLI
jgi:Ni,Fe-hydrogenase maturation factor